MKITIPNLNCRSMSDVPIKVNEFVIIVSDMKSMHNITAHSGETVEMTTDVNSVDNNICTNDFMVLPNKLYKISFYGKRYQFNENSELRVSNCEIIFDEF